MRVWINEKEVVIPSSLSEITLGQRIAYQEQYGNELDKMAASIIGMEDGVEKELESMHFHFEKMFRTFAFFAGTTVEAIKESKFIDEVASIYHASLAVLFEEEQSLELKTEFVWRNEKWVLATPEIKNGSSMKFGEFIDAKQLIKDMIELGKGKWEYMLPICAIYLRRPGEEYNEEFLYEGSERLELMKSLPMDIVLQIGFFLSGTLNICINTLKYSGNPESRVGENMSRATTIDTDG